MKSAQTLLILALFALSAGCATSVGHEFNTSYISKIVRGKTTKADIRQNIGEPHSVTQSAQGETWAYQHIRGGNAVDSFKYVFGGSDLKSADDTLVVIFKGDKVADYSYSKSR